MQGARQDRKVAVRLARVVLGVILLVFTAVFLRVWQEMKIVQLGYQCSELKGRYGKLLEAQRGLMSRRNALASLDRVETIARAELGLQTPSREQIVFLNDATEKKSGFAGLWGGRGAIARRLRSAQAWWPLNHRAQMKEAGLGGQDH